MADNTAKITEEEEDEERREDDDPEQAISTNPEHRVVVVGASQEPPVEDSSSYSSFFTGFGASSCSAIDAETSKGPFDFYSNQHFNSSSYSRIRGGEFDDVGDAYFDDYYRDNKNPQEQEPVNNPNPNPEHHLAALVVPSSPRNAEISEIKNVDGDNENVPRDIDDDASSSSSSEEGYYEFSDKEKEAEYNRSGMRKMTSGEGTSSISRKKRKKKWCDRNRALRRSSNQSHSQNMAHYPPPPPRPPPTQALYQDPMLGGQVSTLLPPQNFYGMQHQPLFIAPATMFPNQALMMHQQPPQYPPVAPFGPFVLGQNFNPQMQPTQSQGFDLGRGGFGRDQHRGRGRGRGQNYGRGRGRRVQNYGRGRSRGRRGQNYGRGRGDGN